MQYTGKPLVSTAHDSYDVKQLAKPSVTRYNVSTYQLSILYSHTAQR